MNEPTRDWTTQQEFFEWRACSKFGVPLGLIQRGDEEYGYEYTWEPLHWLGCGGPNGFSHRFEDRESAEIIRGLARPGHDDFEPANSSVKLYLITLRCRTTAWIEPAPPTVVMADPTLRPDVVEAQEEATPMLIPDDPEADATDFAHPAWWRGHDRTAVVFCQLVTEILDGQDDGSGANYEPWGTVRQRLVKLVKEAKS